MAPPSLTTHLLALSPTALTRATTHPFLPLAATASLPPAKLLHWLAQDRLYALSYLTFVSTLLSHLRLEPGHSTSTPSPSHPAPPSTLFSPSLSWRIADALIDCLTNIRAELKLFEDTARDAGWWEQIVKSEDGGNGTGVRAESVTRAYADLFAGTMAGGRGTLVGLTVLWATEECYLRAWKFAKSHLPGTLGGDQGRRDVMQRVFIPNWTSEEFEGFVGRLKGLVDELAETVERDGWEWRECEGVWGRVLEIEEGFWPSVG